MRDIAGAVILYNPKPEVTKNIKSYSSSLSKLFLIDNSEHPLASDLLKSLEHEKVEYCSLNGNKGMAAALNVAALKAIEAGYSWLLTMDQDSLADERMLEELWKTTELITSEKVGIIAPQYVLPTTSPILDKGTEEVTSVITSGNLLNLNAYAEAGEFREDFFIDYVDHEYCLRLKSKGYKILVNYKALLYHKLGETKQYKLAGKTYSATNHNYIRRYYISRNRLFTIAQYKALFPDFCKEEIKNHLKEIIKIILFESDQYRKLRSVLKGYIDYKSNRLGEYTTA